MDKDNDYLYLQYNNKEMKFNIPQKAFTSKFINELFSEKYLKKILTFDVKKNLEKFLPKDLIYILNNPKELSDFLLNTKTKFFTPIEKFKILYNNNYFSKSYQEKLPYIKDLNIIDYINKKIELKKYFEKKLAKLNCTYNEISVNNNINTNNIRSDSISSEVMSNDSEGDKKNCLNKKNNENIAKIHKDELKSQNNSNIQTQNENNNSIFNMSMNNFYNNMSANLSENEEDSFIDRKILLSERFKNLKKNKNQITIKPRTKEEIDDYRKQEEERYKNPLLPWEYKLQNGNVAIVAPLSSNSKSIVTKPRDHALLKNERPPYITLLSLVRDAAAKLQDGVGTRLDICLLLKESQYITENIPDNQINNIVSGALDRLHYQKDPCVKYDLKYKLWIYLHRNRTLDYPGWQGNPEILNIGEGRTEENIIENKNLVANEEFLNKKRDNEDNKDI